MVEMNTPGSDEPPVDENLPAAEVEAAANALQMMWASERNQEALRYSGCGMSFRGLAQVALTAANMVKGKTLAPAPDQFEELN